MKVFTPILLTLGLASTTALAASFTPGNVVVLRCAGVSSGGNAGALLEYTPSGSVAQTITFPSSGSPAIVFGNTVALPHDISLSGDSALVVIPGYAQTAASIEGTTAAANNRVIATVKWDGTVAYPIVNSALVSANSVRGATSDGFGNFWVTFTGGMRYVTPSAPSTSTTVLNTGSRACAIFNGQLYGSVTAGASSVSPNFPTGGGSYVGYITAATSADGFAIPTGPTIGSKAYVANYNDANGLYAFNWNGSGWDAPYAIKFSVSGNVEHIAVDYSGASPVIYFTTTSGANNGLFKYVDVGSAGTFTPTTLATATGGAIFRGVAMAPTQPALPVCSVSPSDTTVNPGDTAFFGPVAATGANPNAYTWKADYGSGKVTLANGPTGHGSSIIGGATTATLMITNVAAGDLGSYYVEASNNGGTTECGPGVLHFYPTCLTTTLAGITNVAGSTASFSVAGGISGCTAPLTYFWYKNGGPLGDGPTGSGSVISGSSTATLTITGVQDGDADGSPGGPGTSGSTAIYSVTVYDANFTPNSSSAVLTVLDPPVITTQPSSTSKAQGQTANFTVAATGGSLSYNWFKSPSTSPLANGPSGNGSTISGATSSHLVIASVQPGDAGSYIVIATNLAGSATSDPPATLTVGVLPIVGALSPSTNIVGSDAVFAATVTGGTSPFTYTWRHNGTVISDDAFHIFGATTATLGLTNVDIPDRRLYSVSVSNAYGGVTVSALLYVITDTNKPNDVPNLIIYDPFNYPTGPTTAVGFYSWENIISIYNRVSGQPAFWFNTGGGLNSGVVAMDPSSLYTSTARNGGLYPWPGIDCAAVNKWTFAGGGNNNHLKFGGVASGSAYFSLILTGDQGSPSANGTYDVIAGFTSGASDASGANANTWNYKLCTKADDSPGETNPPNVDGPGGYRLGVFKGNNETIDSSSVNGQFASQHLVRGHPYLVVGCYKINSGGTTTNDDVLSLWVEPLISTFGASEANVPAPNAGGMLTNWNNNAPITEFGIRAGLNASPFSKSISDLRIGTTWASVTGPYFPTLKLAIGSPDVMLAWPAKDSFGGYGYHLQTGSDVLGPYAVDGNTPVPNGATNVVTETPVPPQQFWRLAYPPRSGNYGTY